MIAGLNYFPEQTGNAPYTTGLATGLQERGIRTSVMTGYPHYPLWMRFGGYSGSSMSETISGVPVRRLNHYIPRRPRLLARLGMEISFGLRMALAHWTESDVIVFVSPALISSAIGLGRARLTRRRAKVVVWVQDLYSLGMKETGASGEIGARVMRYMESVILRSADGVVVIHDRFRVHLVSQLKVDVEKVQVIRNWTHLGPHSVNDRHTMRASFGWSRDAVIVLHAGNMGAKQGLDNVVQAARVAERSGSPVRFILLGDGNQRSRLETLARGVSTIEFLDPLPGARFQDALSSADVLLVNELPGVKEMSVPSKLTSYFSSGVPVLAATDPGSVTAEELAAAQAGIRVDAGVPEDLVRGAETLASDPETGQRLAANGLRFMRTELSEVHAVAKYDQYLTHLASGDEPLNRQRHHGDNNA